MEYYIEHGWPSEIVYGAKQMYKDYAIIARGHSRQHVMNLFLVLTFSEKHIDEFQVIDKVLDLLPTPNKHSDDQQSLRNFIKSVTRGIHKIRPRMKSLAGLRVREGRIRRTAELLSIEDNGSHSQLHYWLLAEKVVDNLF